MSIPHPANGPVSRSQNTDHLVGLATRYITSHLDDYDGSNDWAAVDTYLREVHGLDKAKAGTITLMAVLDLEYNNTIQYQHGDDRFRRPGLDTDIPPAPLREVAEAVWALGWGLKGTGMHRSVYQTFVDLDGRYRHCDVYWAMHEVLKAEGRLRCVRKNWMLPDGSDPLDDPDISVAEREEIEREREQDLVTQYLTYLGRPVKVEHLFSTRKADIFDAQRRLIIEAKIGLDDVVVLGAVTQAMLYRMLANQVADQVDGIAVLLEGRPSDHVLETLRTNDIDVGFIWRDGREFKEQLV